MVLPPALSRIAWDWEASETHFCSFFHWHNLLFSVICLQYNPIFFPTYIFLLILTFSVFHSPCRPPTSSVSLSSEDFVCFRRSSSPPSLATAFFSLEKKKKRVLNSDPESVNLLLIYTKEHKSKNMQKCHYWTTFHIRWFCNSLFPA